MPPSWLPLVICLVGLAAMATHSLRLRSMRVNPWVLPTGDSAEGFLGRSFLGLIATDLFALGASAVFPAWFRDVAGTVPPLDYPFSAWAGVSVMIVGMTLVLAAQRQMGKAWRIGIPKNDQPSLVTTGLFRYSRNPIFLGMFIVGLGITLVVPNAVTLATLAATYLGLSVQVRLEETYLQDSLGEDYGQYWCRVDRWFGAAGRGILEA